MARRGGHGRQRVPMEIIENESNRQVTLSKRRSGAFKNELSTLTSAQTAVIITDRFMNGGNPAADPPTGSSTAEDERTQEIIRAHQRDNQNRLNEEVYWLETLVENEKRRGQAIKEVRKASESRNLNWWEHPIDELDFQQLEQLKVVMERVKSNTEDQVGAMQEAVDNDRTNGPVILPPNVPINPTAQPGNGELAALNRVPAFDPVT